MLDPNPNLEADMTAWRKVASVTTGGQPYFYVRYDQDSYPYAVRDCIVWDRSVLAYRAERNDKALGFFSSVAEAKHAF